MSFPLCDSETGDTIPVCTKDCLNYHSNCGIGEKCSKVYETIDYVMASCSYSELEELPEIEEEVGADVVEEEAERWLITNIGLHRCRNRDSVFLHRYLPQYERRDSAFADNGGTKSYETHW